MTALNVLKRRLRPGQVYRRKELAHWSNAVDRHLRLLIEEGRLERVGPGLYMTLRKTRFGLAPARPEKLIEGFLGDDRFLIVPPNAYNSLGLGTTQLYNEPVVYNRKRYGRFELDGRPYIFRKLETVPPRLSEEFLLVDLLHNLDRLAENKAVLLRKAQKRAETMDLTRLTRALRVYGSARAERLLKPVLGDD
ncbi:MULTISPECIES: hypothetical protein [Hyphomonas]|nr:MULTISPECIES: hypothetical protein [Hyphomonas]MBB41616.1 hypothetical protein [Hyphomonas sp.]|tara:strand:+ start:673 stop:1251 length:579 start_codon:yes stop_codon:yes gene_type:complete